MSTKICPGISITPETDALLTAWGKQMPHGIKPNRGNVITRMAKVLAAAKWQPGYSVELLYVPNTNSILGSVKQGAAVPTPPAPCPSK